MSIGPVGTAISAAGSPLAQTKGAEVERAREEVGAERRQVYYDEMAEAAAGVGEPDGEDHETSERDGDGRRVGRPAGRREPYRLARHTAEQRPDPSERELARLDGMKRGEHQACNLGGTFGTARRGRSVDGSRHHAIYQDARDGQRLRVRQLL